MRCDWLHCARQTVVTAFFRKTFHGSEWPPPRCQQLPASLLQLSNRINKFASYPPAPTAHSTTKGWLGTTRTCHVEGHWPLLPTNGLSTQAGTPLWHTLQFSMVNLSYLLLLSHCRWIYWKLSSVFGYFFTLGYFLDSGIKSSCC